MVSWRSPTNNQPFQRGHLSTILKKGTFAELPGEGFFITYFFETNYSYFLLYVRIRYSFSDLKVFDKHLFYGVLLQKNYYFGDLEVLRSMLQCKSSRRFSIHEKHYNSIGSTFSGSHECNYSVAKKNDVFCMTGPESQLHCDFM